MTTIIPGFLGTAEEWDFCPFPHTVVDLLTTPSPQSLAEWAPILVSYEKDLPKILIGYSLGGRIALHALTAYPEHFTKAVIISAHTGLSSEEERKTRIKNDAAWAARFAAESWDSVMADWNAQPVFGGSEKTRHEKNYDRRHLSHALTSWSLGTQKDLLPSLSGITTEILWITGAHDKKFTAIGDTACEALPNSRHWVCPHAGHRVPLENPDAFLSVVTDFLQKP